MLYYKDNEHKENCDFCDTPRYVDGSNKVPCKVLRYMPITLRRWANSENDAMAQRSSLLHVGQNGPPTWWWSLVTIWCWLARVCTRGKERATRLCNWWLHTIWPHGCFVFLLAGVCVSKESSTRCRHEARIHLSSSCYPWSRTSWKKF